MSRRLRSCAVPHADEVGRGARVRVARVGDTSGGHIEGKDSGGVRILVGSSFTRRASPSPKSTFLKKSAMPVNKNGVLN